MPALRRGLAVFMQQQMFLREILWCIKKLADTEKCNLKMHLSGELSKEDCASTACYCEENVHRLIQQLKTRDADVDRLFVAFVSNNARQVPIWNQQAGGGGLVVWDYHVFLLQAPPSPPPPHALPPKSPSAAAGNSKHETERISPHILPPQNILVWDLDSLLPFPSDFSHYASKAFLGGVDGESRLPSRLQRFYRVIPAATFVAHFASDRRHMRGPDGGWLAPPPPHPCIQPGGANNNKGPCSSSSSSVTDRVETLHHNLETYFPLEGEARSFGSGFFEKGGLDILLQEALHGATRGSTFAEGDFLRLFGVRPRPHPGKLMNEKELNWIEY
jgi:protein N-terminal glutamine amidohydrolase